MRDWNQVEALLPALQTRVDSRGLDLEKDNTGEVEEGSPEAFGQADQAAAAGPEDAEAGDDTAEEMSVIDTFDRCDDAFAEVSPGGVHLR